MQRNRDSVSQAPESLAVTTHGFAHFFSECKIRVKTVNFDCERAGTPLKRGVNAREVRCRLSM
jgi:hypothetical protein